MTIQSRARSQWCEKLAESRQLESLTVQVVPGLFNDIFVEKLTDSRKLLEHAAFISNNTPRNPSRSDSVAHDKGIRAPQHLRRWQVPQTLAILCSCQRSIQTKHPYCIVLLCGWLQIYGSLACVNRDCLCWLPGYIWNMHPAPEARLSANS